MSVLIKGMKLPKNGYLAIVPTGEVFISGNGWGFQSYGWSIQPDGQTIELPDHGDLIDKDVVLDALDLMAANNRLHDAYDFVKSCEAVIPAERK